MPNVLVCGQNCAELATKLRSALRAYNRNAPSRIDVTASNFAKEPEKFDAVIVRGDLKPMGEYRLKILLCDTAGAPGCGATVTCGLSRDCDFSFSSIRQNRLQVCLSRELTDAVGRCVEPFEAPVRGALGNADAILSAQALAVYFPKS